MSEHYYTKKPQTASDRRAIEVTLRGHRLRLASDAGVFSRDGVDYGSRTLIDMMEFRDDADVLDVGCGYGPIGLAAARLAPRGHVTMLDINERAVALANENAAANGIVNAAAMQSDLYEAVAERRFDVILSNPPIRAGKAVVHRILTDARDHLREGGALWIVIQNKQGAPSAKAKLQEVFGEEAVEEIGKDKGYRIYRAKMV
ncbi:class I SAM-dependent methyltransferase [Cohnella lubricantis]|uniref:Class I SAM-dependent methyltransferase n=1 Tax=Cohnella lubricantis TaxID=2163172 RepID=A0A841TL34_9BACL|nr:class I SAM-dependent methyltransferase [Cohnella lubricantis]MBB6679251.1 class I SAM-dependent methyltransferase [Cohnella lubricantis]MBP2119581.1 16S rRNA (guanine1207-N2)-methyltransferase [Cohnella lubricantis]